MSTWFLDYELSTCFEYYLLFKLKFFEINYFARFLGLSNQWNNSSYRDIATYVSTLSKTLLQGHMHTSNSSTL